MAGWNDVFDESTDWTAASFLQMFWNAYIERVKILTSLYRRHARRVVELDSGDPWHSYPWRNIVRELAPAPASPADRNLSYARPALIAAGDPVARAVPHSQPFPYLTDGDFQFAGDPARYTFCIQLLQGLASAQNGYGPAGEVGWGWAVDEDEDAWPTAWTWSELAAAVGIDPGGFTRKLPAEFRPGQTRYNVYSGRSAGMSQVNADSRNPAMGEGQRARCLESGSGLVAGWVYRRVGGAWEPDGGVPTWLTGHGFIEPGDYIGPWLWNEIRDCMNRLRWTVSMQPYSLSPAAGEKYGHDRCSDNVFNGTYAAAREIVDAGWPQTPNIAWPPPFGASAGHYALGERTFDADGVEVSGHAMVGRQATVLRTPISTHAPARVRLFVDVSRPNWFDGAQFHDGGDGVVEGRQVIEQWDVSQGGEEVVARPLGSIAGALAWPEVPGGVSQVVSAGWGWELKDHAWLAQWDVAGGLEYRAER